MNEPSTCSNCRFYKPIAERPNFGKCKWGPPNWVPPAGVRTGALPGESRAAWPTVPGSEYCFRWETWLPKNQLVTKQDFLDAEREITHRTEIAKLAADFTVAPESAQGGELGVVEVRHAPAGIKETTIVTEQIETPAPQADAPAEQSTTHLPASTIVEETGASLHEENAPLATSQVGQFLRRKGDQPKKTK